MLLALRRHEDVYATPEMVQTQASDFTGHQYGHFTDITDNTDTIDTIDDFGQH